jgi:putative tricarboxylic transport membrane protein
VRRFAKCAARPGFILLYLGFNMSTQIEQDDGSLPAIERSEAAITIRTTEIIIGVLLAIFALVVIASNYQLGAGWADDGPEAGYFPMRMGVVILIASIAVVVQAVRANDRSAFVEREQLKLVATILIPLIVYVATIQFIGIYVASALFIGIFMMAIGKFNWWKSLVVGAGTNLVFFWIFEIAFKVPLPKGPLEHLFGF